MYRSRDSSKLKNAWVVFLFVCLFFFYLNIEFREEFSNFFFIFGFLLAAVVVAVDIFLFVAVVYKLLMLYMKFIIINHMILISCFLVLFSYYSLACLRDICRRSAQATLCEIKMVSNNKWWKL